MGKEVVIEVPNEIKYIREASSRILDALKPYNTPEDALFDIKLCVEEAIRNAILHGNKKCEKSAVRVSYIIEADRITIAVEDGGEGFDYNKVPDPTKNDNLTKGGGRGIYLIKKLMDSVEYSKSGSRVTMIKKLKLHG